MDRQRQAGSREQTDQREQINQQRQEGHRKAMGPYRSADRLERMRLCREVVRGQKDMREVLAGYGVAIRGRTCRCPFHNDKNASAQVFRDGLHCFAEGRGYDVFDAVMHFEGCSFAGALEKLSGGSPTWEEWMQGRRVLIKRRQEQERRRLAAERWKRQAARVRALREEERTQEPFSERWCRAANALPYAVYLLEALQEDELRGGKV